MLLAMQLLDQDPLLGRQVRILSAHECNTFLSWKLRTLPTLDKVLHFYLELGGSCVLADCGSMGTMILHLHLVRHGQTTFNKYNRLQGWCNAPLTASGLADADRAGHKLEGYDFAAAYCSDTSRAEITAKRILDINEAAGHARPELTADMHFREQCYGYFEGQDMSLAWTAAGGPHGAKDYNDIVAKFGLAASRDFLKEADPFHDAESDEEYWARVEGAFALIAENPALKDGDDVLQISHGNTLLSLGHRFGGPDLDLSERPANGSVTVLDFDTTKPFSQAVPIVSYGK